MTFNIVSLGDLVADLIVPVPRLPQRPQDHQRASDLLIEAGGTGNFLFLIKRLGMQITALGAVGQDLLGQQVMAELQREGINVEYVVAAPNSRTTTSIVLIDAAGDHVFVWMPGTGAQLEFDPAWQPLVAQADAVFVTGYSLLSTATFSPAAVIAGLEIARAQAIPVFFDLGPATEHTNRADVEAVISRTNVFLATNDEIAAWTGDDDPLTAAQHMLTQGPKCVIVKLGAQGCLIADNERHITIGGFPAEVRNSAGAGDAFSAACVYAYLHGYSFEQLGTLCNAVGALSVATLGTGASLPHPRAVAHLLASYGHTFFTSA